MIAAIGCLFDKWRIIETGMWPREFLDLCVPAFLQVNATGQGEMAYGALEAALDRGFTPQCVDFE